MQRNISNRTVFQVDREPGGPLRIEANGRKWNNSFASGRPVLVAESETPFPELAVPSDPVEQVLERLHVSLALISCSAGCPHSRVLAPVICYEAAFGGHERQLHRGERAVIPLLAQDQRATAISRGYVFAYPDTHCAGVAVHQRSLRLD